ncbi:hypothetical protein C8F01DRAFT_1264902 [Mycena amicta]|nr:hypothetical protein C8F01DRAFT_1264902 [Mycena amicta]
MLQAAPLSDSYMIPFIEFFFDSTRTFLDLMLNGTVSAHPATMFSTWDMSSYPGRGEVQRLTAPDIEEMFARQFYFDLAGVCMPNQIHHLLRWVNSSRLLYGSDVPFTPDHGAEKLLRAIEDELPKMFDESEIHGIYEGNARWLLGMVDG